MWYENATQNSNFDEVPVVTALSQDANKCIFVASPFLVRAMSTDPGGVARLYSALATDGTLDGVHVLAPETVAPAITEQVNVPDLVLEWPTRYGLSFQLTMPERKLGPGPRAFGHVGAGGSLGFADPDAHVAIGYSMNQGRAGWQHKHVRQLIDLVYAPL